MRQRDSGVLGVFLRKIFKKVICAKFSLGDVREVILQEFYPGKEGFDAVRAYWKSQRSRGDE
jgi:hypothetical protein